MKNFRTSGKGWCPPPSTAPPRAHLAACSGPLARLGLIGLALTAILLGPGTSIARDDQLEEDALKAAYVYKFAHFVTWPEPPAPPARASEALQPAEAETQSARRRIHLCVTGRPSLEKALRATIASHQAGEKEIVIRRIERGDSTSACQMLFLADSFAKYSDEIIEAIGDRPILTIGETDGFAERGGMINLSVAGRKIRLQVNRRAAERSRLKVSSQVLKLAQLVAEDSE